MKLQQSAAIVRHMSEQNLHSLPPHIRAAQDFYEGMAQAVHEVENTFVSKARQEFSRRDSAAEFDQAFSKQIQFSKVLHHMVSGAPRAPVPHLIPLLNVEYFACISALNLYRLPELVEQFKVELLTEAFLELCHAREQEWLGIYGADVPQFKAQTGHAFGQWRADVVRSYLRALQKKSSLDKDALVAVTLLLSRMALSKAQNIPVSPVMLQSLSALLEMPTGWLSRYIRFRPF